MRTGDGRIVLVVPLAPAASGNGLAMRAGMVLEALAARREVDVVIVPVAGPAEPREWAAEHARQLVVVPAVDASNANAHVVRQLGDAPLRSRLERTAPLPRRAALAPPSLATDIVDLLDEGATGSTVVSMREYLVPLGVTLAQQLDATRTVVDLDDDIESLLHAQGEPVEAAAYGRIAREWLGDADVVTAASPAEAAQMAARYGLHHIEAVPNTVRPPTRVSPAPGRDKLLYVGNLTYGPNVDAARALVEDVLPALRRVRPNASVTLVGRADERLADLAGRPAVTVAGEVDDVGPWYAGTDVVVIPLRSASGTRIKVLEAFAHRRPVVATPAALAGLAVVHGVDVAVAGDPDAIARTTAHVLARPDRARMLTAEAYATFTAKYAPGAVAPIVRRVMLGEDGGSGRDA